MIQQRHLKYVLLVLLNFLLLWTVPSGAWAKTKVFKVATGEYMGRYLPTGGVIAEIVNNKQEEYGFRCIAKTTSGSVFNINAIMAGDMEFGIVQSDSQYQALNGLDEWKDKGPQKDLRSMFSLYTESITLLASVDSGAKTIKDLKGKRVYIGEIGSGSRQNAIDALNAAGIDWKTDIKVIKKGKKYDVQSMLMRGELDAFFYTVGHPTSAIIFATVGAKKTLFISIDNIEKLLSKHPYYVKSLIPVSLYPQIANDEDVKTFGVKATFVTSAKIPDNVVYAITKEVFENLGSLKYSDPTLNMLTKESMVKDGLTAPMHPGALRYYKEAGLK
ncbi:MAG: TAXI family TRAP transporter solute-binding subunit [Desulfobacterales bacterium]